MFPLANRDAFSDSLMTHDERFPGIDERIAFSALLGYLNFSTGKSDPRFQKQFHDAWAFITEHGSEKPWQDIPTLLRDRLEKLRQSGAAAFADSSQADAVIAIAFQNLPAAYRVFHADLLGHVADADLWQPFFLLRTCESVLSQRGPWDEIKRITDDALKQLNDYVGHRPIPILENERRGEIYPHERIRPVPLYIREIGASVGPYRQIVEMAIKILADTPDDIRSDAFFELDLLDELALDPRAYDFNHPADKRPNYCFGEWDPHFLDNQGRYRRFVLRQVLLNGLLRRSELGPNSEEMIFESAAVLAGTILMASAVCGSTPQSHDSTVTLANLVPRVAKMRESFYAYLLPTIKGKHAERLQKEAKQLKQPFGGVRQALNQHLANQRALQLQQRHLAELLAEIGYADAARRQAARIPVVSVRVQTEMQCLLTTGRIMVEQGRLPEAAKLLPHIEDLLKRGILCGALPDPWNILGFAGQYPRFQAVEDAVRDIRIDDLIHLVDQLFNLYARMLSEGAYAGTFKPDKDLAKEMHRLAEWWDRFATTTVNDIEHVHGAEATQSAEHVARSLTRWRERGGGAADLAFWRDQIDGFRSPKAFALVVEALLTKRDFRASASLLVTWLGQSDKTPLDQGEHSFHPLTLRWMLGISLAIGEAENVAAKCSLLELSIKFFDYLEANADESWNVPRLDLLGVGEDAVEDDGETLDADAEDDDIYGAAYDDMTYQDSTDDDVEGSVMDAAPVQGFDLGYEAERLEKRLQFLSTLARLWNIAARTLQAEVGVVSMAPSAVSTWLKRAQQNDRELRDLLQRIHDHDIPKPTGAFDGMSAYERQRSAKERLLNQAIATCLDHALALGAMNGLLERGEPNYDGESWHPFALQLEHALMHAEVEAARDILPRFLDRFGGEPLLYTPLAQGGHPHLILRASLAQMMLRGLVHNLPKQGMIRETYQLLRFARSMEANQTLSGPRITEYDRLFQFGLQAAVEAVMAGARHEAISSDRLMTALETIVEPFAVTWRDHSQTLRVATLELVTHERDWLKLIDFIKRYGRELFHARFLAMGNLRGILLRGVGQYLRDIQEEPDPLRPLKLVDDLDKTISREDAERTLQVILQTLVENYDHLRDYNATTTQSDYGENIYRLFDYLRLKSRYDRAAWLLKPLSIVHEVLARRDGTAAALWRKRVEAITEDSADRYVQDLAKLERSHGIRLATIRDRIDERFVRPMVIDHLCALIEPAIEDAKKPRDPDDISPLEKELAPFANTPSGVGLDLPPWLVRLANELERVETTQSDLSHLAETAFHMPQVDVPFAFLVDQMADWEKRIRDEET